MKKLLGIIVALYGIYLMISGAITTFQDRRDFMSAQVETTATVTKVEKFKTTERRRHKRRKKVTKYKTYFEYEANGETADAVITFSSYKETGDTFTVWYDKNNPGDVRSKKATYWDVVFVIGMGLLITVSGGFMFIAACITKE